MRKQVRDFLTFTKLEKEGVFVFLLLILFICGLIYTMDWINWKANPNSEKLKSEFERVKHLFDSVQAAKPTSSTVYQDFKGIDKDNQLIDMVDDTISFAPFDPNHFSLEIGASIGLTENQSNSILKYLNKGGQFKIKSDFKKMYVISDEKYKSLEPFIMLPENFPAKDKIKFEQSTKVKSTSPQINEPYIADINSADSAALRKVKGIGGYYAKSIVAYREKLGGYVQLEQLMEINGTDEERYLALQPFLKITNPKPFRKINVNTITKEELKLHPYFDWNLTRSLINYRDNHGKFKNIQDLNKLQLIDTNIYRKIAPYLTL